MSQQGDRWRLEEQEDGTLDVYQGRRRHKAGIDPVEAMRFILKQVKPEDSVFVVEPDGYRTNITRTVRRRLTP